MYSALDQILREKKVINDQVIDFSQSASYDSLWEPESDPTIEDGEDRIESIELENDESEESEYEWDPREDESSEYENYDEAINDEVSSLQSEAAVSNKESDTIFHSKQAKRKANREVQYQSILSRSNQLIDQLMQSR